MWNQKIETFKVFDFKVLQPVKQPSPDCINIIITQRVSSYGINVYINKTNVDICQQNVYSKTESVAYIRLCT